MDRVLQSTDDQRLTLRNLMKELKLQLSIQKVGWIAQVFASSSIKLFDFFIELLLLFCEFLLLKIILYTYSFVEYIFME